MSNTLWTDRATSIESRNRNDPHIRQDHNPVLPQKALEESDKKHGDAAKRNNDDKDEKEDGKKTGDKPKSKLPFIILAIVAIAAIAGGVAYWLTTRGQESTDDAYTEGNAVPIAPKISGYVIERHVNDNTLVRAGDLMIRIDPRDYINSRDQARANLDLARAQLASSRVNLEITRVSAPAALAQAQAQLTQSRANQTDAARAYERQRNVDQRATTQSNVDQANAQFQANNASVSSSQAQVQTAGLVTQNIQLAESTVKQQQAQVEQGEANLAQAELNLSYTEIRAPQDGHVTLRNVDVGTYAQAGQQIFYLVTPTYWVVANFKETQLARMHPGQPVKISVDAYPGLNLNGHVQSIQEGSGARFTAFPAENATGNFVKIVRRVPVKITIDPSDAGPTPEMPLGISVAPVVTVQ